MLVSLIVGGFILVVTFVIIAFSLAPTKLDKQMLVRFGRAVVDPLHHQVRAVEDSVRSERRIIRLQLMENILNRYYFHKKVTHLIQQADLRTTASFVFMVSGVSPFIILAISYIFLFPLPLAIMVALGAAIAPYAYLLYRRQVRMRAFEKGLGEAIKIFSRCLQTGLSISAALEVIADESPSPVKEEFDTVRQQISIGGDFRASMLEMLARVPSSDLRFLVTALLIQRDTGGNVIGVLDQAEALIRERIKLKGDLEAKTAQGRLTGLILIALPFILGTFMFLSSPGYLTPLLSTSLGHKAIYIGLAMECVGATLIYRLTQVEI